MVGGVSRVFYPAMLHQPEAGRAVMAAPAKDFKGAAPAVILPRNSCSIHHATGHTKGL